MSPRAKPPVFQDVWPTARQARTIASRLLQWYDAEKRDLPWRRTGDPYAILVSEFMLQQTQVATVVPFYERFLERFPTLADLAAAREQDVLRQWAGLGYYSRARNLLEAARRIHRDYGGRVPDRVGDLLFLPGVGRYVAGAVASIAFGTPAPAVDGNVTRVVSRLFVIAEDPKAMRVRRGLDELVLRLMPPERAGDFNQAMMELGARICTAARPLCGECPLAGPCRAAMAGNPEAYPPPRVKTETVAVEEACGVIRNRDGQRFFLVRRSGRSGRYRSMWEFPGVEVASGDRSAGRKLSAYLRENWGVRARVGEEWAEVRHQVTHHRIRKRVFLLVAEKGADGKPRPVSAADADEAGPISRWATLDEIEELPLGAPHRRIRDLLRESTELHML